MVPRPRILLALLLSLLTVGACGKRHEYHSQVALTVIVTDPEGYAWEGVEVRIVEAWTEWSACTCPGREPWSVGYTDRYGEVAFDPQRLSEAQLGFQESPAGVAVLGSYAEHDQATVTLLVGHDQLGWVRIEVPLTYRDSQVDVFVEIDAPRP